MEIFRGQVKILQMPKWDRYFSEEAPVLWETKVCAASGSCQQNMIARRFIGYVKLHNNRSLILELALLFSDNYMIQ